MEKTMYEIVIGRYINGEADNFSEIRALGYKNVILDYFRRYLKKHPESIDKINYLLEHFDELMIEEIPREDLISVIKSETSRNTSKTMDLIYNMLTLSKEEALLYLKKGSYTQTQLDQYLNRFKNRFPNQEKEIAYLSSLFNSYESPVYKQTQKQYVNGSINLQTIKDNKEKVKLLYVSGFSIEEFCSRTGCSISVMNNECKKILGTKNIELKKMAEAILNRDNSEFLKELKDIALILSEKKDLDVIDYYELTRLSVHDFKQLVEPLIDYKVFKVLYTRIKKAYAKLPYTMSKKAQLESRNIIGGREITTEEKEQVFNFLEINNIPTTAYTIALRKYLNGDLELPKIYTKKK